ncbi:unnamed protein product [Amoebophrya sp. A120]|nr:unnamed protein product [Amoebophrya sp. A120]|eukprot:GSA120T00024153001.1
MLKSHVSLQQQLVAAFKTCLSDGSFPKPLADPEILTLLDAAARMKGPVASISMSALDRQIGDANEQHLVASLLFVLEQIASLTLEKLRITEHNAGFALLSFGTILENLDRMQPSRTSRTTTSTRTTALVRVMENFLCREPMLDLFTGTWRSSAAERNKRRPARHTDWPQETDWKSPKVLWAASEILCRSEDSQLSKTSRAIDASAGGKAANTFDAGPIHTAKLPHYHRKFCEHVKASVSRALRINCPDSTAFEPTQAAVRYCAKTIINLARLDESRCLGKLDTARRNLGKSEDTTSEQRSQQTKFYVQLFSRGNYPENTETLGALSPPAQIVPQNHYRALRALWQAIGTNCSPTSINANAAHAPALLQPTVAGHDDPISYEELLVLRIWCGKVLDEILKTEENLVLRTGISPCSFAAGGSAPALKTTAFFKSNDKRDICNFCHIAPKVIEDLAAHQTASSRRRSRPTTPSPSSDQDDVLSSSTSMSTYQRRRAQFRNFLKQLLKKQTPALPGLPESDSFPHSALDEIEFVNVICASLEIMVEGQDEPDFLQLVLQRIDERQRQFCGTRTTSTDVELAHDKFRRNFFTPTSTGRILMALADRQVYQPRFLRRAVDHLLEVLMMKNNFPRTRNEAGHVLVDENLTNTILWACHRCGDVDSLQKILRLYTCSGAAKMMNAAGAVFPGALPSPSGSSSSLPARASASLAPASFENAVRVCFSCVCCFVQPPLKFLRELVGGLAWCRTSSAGNGQHSSSWKTRMKLQQMGSVVAAALRLQQILQLHDQLSCRGNTVTDAKNLHGVSTSFGVPTAAISAAQTAIVSGDHRPTRAAENCENNDTEFHRSVLLAIRNLVSSSWGNRYNMQGSFRFLRVEENVGGFCPGLSLDIVIR